jgi:N-acetylglucosamine-6-sulfatase
VAWEFYDLTKDPREMNNRYADAEYKKVISGLKKQLKKLRKDLGETDEKYPRIQKIIDAHWDD